MEETVEKAYQASISLHYISIVIYALAILGGIYLIVMTILMGFKNNLTYSWTIFIMATLLFTSHLMALRGLNNKMLWGYRLSKALGIIMLFAFPLGTVIGALLLSELAKYRVEGSQLILNKASK